MQHDTHAQGATACTGQPTGLGTQIAALASVLHNQRNVLHCCRTTADSTFAAISCFIAAYALCLGLVSISEVPCDDGCRLRQACSSHWTLQCMRLQAQYAQAKQKRDGKCLLPCQLATVYLRHPAHNTSMRRTTKGSHVSTCMVAIASV